MNKPDLFKSIFDMFSHEYMTLGTKRVHPVHGWLIMGILVGFVAGVAFVANSSGGFNTIQAATIVESPSLTSTTYSKSQINLMWSTSNTGVTGVEIWRATATSTLSKFSKIKTLSGSSYTSYTDTNLSTSLTGITYFYRLRTLSKDATTRVVTYSPYSNIASATTQSTLYPTQPTNLSASLISSPLAIKLSWRDKANNESGFKIERARSVSGPWQEIATTLTNIVTYSDASVLPGTSYSYRVRASNSTGDSPYSNIVSKTTSGTAPDTQAPSVSTFTVSPADSPVTSPQTLTLTAAVSDNVGVSMVTFSKGSTVICSLPGTGPSASYTCGWTVSAMDNGSHTLTVTAYDGAGNNVVSNSISFTIAIVVDTTAPSTPTNLTAVPVSSNNINLSWDSATDNVGVVGYKLLRNSTVIELATTSYQDSNLTASTTYSYSVSAVDAAGNTSPVSPSISATTLAAPTSGVGSGSTFTNANTILLPTPPGTGSASNAVPGEPGSLYPSTIAVSGLGTSISSLRVVINDLRHTIPDDIDMLLVGPQGQKMIIWSDVGGFNSTCGPAFNFTICNNTTALGSTGPTVTLDDSAPTDLSAVTAISTTAYKPTNVGNATDMFPAPAPVSPYGNPQPDGIATLGSVFNGTNPNGIWRLYVIDDGLGGTGRINGGWSLIISTN